MAKVKRMDRETLIAIVLFGLLLASYVILSALNNPSANLVGELLKYVTIAIVSYFFGKSRKIEALHLKKPYLIRTGLMGIGFGVALIISHVALFGVDLLDPFGHEWIGLYVLITSMIALGLAKRM